MKRTLYFSNEFWNKLKKKSEELGIKPSQYIRMVLSNYWKKGE